MTPFQSIRVLLPLNSEANGGVGRHHIECDTDTLFIGVEGYSPVSEIGRKENDHSFLWLDQTQWRFCLRIKHVVRATTLQPAFGLARLVRYR